MARSNEETVSGYFRKIFAENPKLLRGRSNQELLDRWLKDHPGQKEVPAKVKANLSNVKSVLRKKMRKGGRPKKVVDASAQSAAPVAPGDTRASRLEQLEEQIDDCLSLAKSVDRARLAHVISLLRQARNVVVWHEGK
jgi:hypothetical protein